MRKVNKHDDRNKPIFNFARTTVNIVSFLITALVIVTSLYVLITPRSQPIHSEQPLRKSDNQIQQRPPSSTSLHTSSSAFFSTLVEDEQWMQFISKTGGFSINYPTNWVPVEHYSENGGVIFKLANPQKDQNQLIIGVSIALLPSSWNMKRVVEAKVSSVPQSNLSPLVQNKTSVDGLEAIKLVGREEGFRMIEVFVIKENILYTIWAQPYDSEHPEFAKWTADLNTLHNTMVDSFHFLN